MRNKLNLGLALAAALGLMAYMPAMAEEVQDPKCPGFVDADGDGVCDNVGQGPGHGQGLRDGSGGGRGQGIGQGPRDGRGGGRGQGIGQGPRDGRGAGQGRGMGQGPRDGRGAGQGRGMGQGARDGRGRAQGQGRGQRLGPQDGSGPRGAK